MELRQFSLIDHILSQIDYGLNVVFSSSNSIRTNPAALTPDACLTEKEQKHSGALMRINHCGEVCAQALYQSQQLLARTPDTHEMLKQAAKEETDHLAWTQQRIMELSTHTSYLNLFWYSHSFLIGVCVGLVGDRWSLGFVEETEQQVFSHLEKHLNELAQKDHKSHAIIKQMQLDEQHHGEMAKQAGAQSLPTLVKSIMRFQSKVMTTLTYWI